ncbi:hypothetical protein SAMN04244575_04870 [Sinorhizobium meliloti]|nr:hypothetical protein SAMN04244575_04870 [Sinorhizobium meliloti]
MVSRPLHPLVGAISHRFARGTNDAAPSTAADWHIASRPVRIGKQAGVSLTQCPQTRLLLPIDAGRLADARLGADFRNPAHERLLRVRTVMASSSSVCCRPSHPADSRSSDKNCRVGVKATIPSIQIAVFLECLLQLVDQPSICPTRILVGFGYKLRVANRFARQPAELNGIAFAFLRNRIAKRRRQRLCGVSPPFESTLIWNDRSSLSS